MRVFAPPVGWKEAACFGRVLRMRDIQFTAFRPAIYPSMMDGIW
jgi:hypothetical protein